jgi:hypothetical protein
MNKNILTLVVVGALLYFWHKGKKTVAAAITPANVPSQISGYTSDVISTIPVSSGVQDTSQGYIEDVNQGGAPGVVIVAWKDASGNWNEGTMAAAKASNAGQLYSPATGRPLDISV